MYLKFWENQNHPLSKTKGNNHRLRQVESKSQEDVSASGSAAFSSPEKFDYLDQSRIRSGQGRMKFYVLYFFALFMHFYQFFHMFNHIFTFKSFFASLHFFILLYF